MKKPSSTPTLYTVNGLSEQTGVDRRTIKKRLRDVAPRKTDGGNKLYALEDLTAATEQTTDSDSLKEQKLKEEVRKLKLANDIKERLLVPRQEQAAAIRRAGAGIVPIGEAKFVNEAPVAGSMLEVPQLRIVLRRYWDSFLEECQKLA
jgi:hypothetical protein